MINNAITFFRRQWLLGRNTRANRHIFVAVLTIGGFTLLVQLLNTLREVVVASIFGTSGELAAFLIAFLLPSFLVSVISGSFNAALIPKFIAVHEQHGAEAAQKLLSGCLVCVIGLLVSVAIGVGFFAPGIIAILAKNFTPEKKQLALTLFLLLLPVIVLSGIATIWIAVLNAGEKYVLGAVAPACIPLASVSFLLIFRKFGIYSLALGVTAGFIFECVILGYALRKRQYRLWPRWHGMTAEMRSVISQYVPMIAGSLIMSSADLIDKFMASMLSPSSVAEINYGQKIIAFILGIGAMALGTAVLPQFSSMAARRDWHSIRHTLRTYLPLVLLLSLGLSILLYWSSGLLVQILFQRGAFSTSDSEVVTQVQRMFIFQVPFYLASMLFVRLISALQQNQILLWGALINLPLNVILNQLLMRWIGVAGIALSTSCVYFFSFCYLGLMVNLCLKKHEQEVMHG